MRFGHARSIWEQFPQLVPGILRVGGIHPKAEVAGLIEGAAVIAAVMQPLAALVFVADGIYLGLLRVRYLAYSTGVGAVVAAVVLGASARLGWDLTGIWWAIAAMVAARLAVLAATYPRALATAI